MASYRAKRLRHILRRIGEVSPLFLARKVWSEARKEISWLEFALLRAAPRLRHTADRAAAFDDVGKALRTAIENAWDLRASSTESSEYRFTGVLEHRVMSCLGFGEVRIPEGSEWQRDPVSGYSWPMAFFTRVNFISHGQDADVKICWEVSRFQWALSLAEISIADANLERRARAQAALLGHLDDWWSANPPGFGVNWTVGMEVAIRAINLGLTALVTWPRLEERDRRLFLTILAAHHRYLRRFPEESDLAGNHQLLCLCGTMFLEGVVLNERQEFDLRFPERVSEICAQFSSDGLHIEHAPTYHRLCVEALAWCTAVAHRVGTVDEGTLRETLSKATKTLAQLEQPNGLLPVLGDSDSGQIVSTGESSRGVQYLRGLAGHVLSEPGFLAAVANSAPGFTMLNELMTSRGPSRIRRIGPFIVARAERVSVVMRAGTHGLGGRASHDHDDNGAPWVVIDGSDVFVDKGCYTYTRDRDRRNADIASAGHNLLLVENTNRFKGRPGAISTVVADAPVPREFRLHENEDALRWSVELEWEDPRAGIVRHVRKSTIPNMAVTHGVAAYQCADTVVLSRSAHMTVRWYLSPLWAVEACEGDGVKLSHRHRPAKLQLKFTSSIPDIRLAVVEESVAELYGQNGVASVIQVHANVAASWNIVSHLLLLPDKEHSR